MGESKRGLRVNVDVNVSYEVPIVLEVYVIAVHFVEEGYTPVDVLIALDNHVPHGGIPVLLDNRHYIVHLIMIVCMLLDLIVVIHLKLVVVLQSR
ncbi:hypothetical protein FNV43_RR21259 [Rhamnella rubrinervis]|uniref:Uncharacterized protein n=1 Tax=Rhamnella rubrinervis TaxID=2594499 RepID=A0A8K0DVX4_9ROSA|nr:hypothetical protein FNV43_RR21259 [Rhamnella rubrinervis]